MLGSFSVMATVAVKDLALAKKFYTEVLGLKVIADRGEEVLLGSSSSKLEVYRSEFAGSNKATYATWEVDDVENTCKELASNGLAFEHYDMPGVTRQGDVHVMGDLHAAWFKDPDGNILCIANMH